MITFAAVDGELEKRPIALPDFLANRFGTCYNALQKDMTLVEKA